MSEVQERIEQLKKAVIEAAESGEIVAWSRSEFLGQWSQSMTYKVPSGAEIVVTLREPKGE